MTTFNMRGVLIHGQKVVLTANTEFAPYKCNHCKKVFIDEANLQKHKYKNHKIFESKISKLTNEIWKPTTFEKSSPFKENRQSEYNFRKYSDENCIFRNEESPLSSMAEFALPKVSPAFQKRTENSRVYFSDLTGNENPQDFSLCYAGGRKSSIMRLSKAIQVMDQSFNSVQKATLDKCCNAVPKALNVTIQTLDLQIKTDEFTQTDCQTQPELKNKNLQVDIHKSQINAWTATNSPENDLKEVLKNTVSTSMDSIMKIDESRQIIQQIKPVNQQTKDDKESYRIESNQLSEKAVDDKSSTSKQTSFEVENISEKSSNQINNECPVRYYFQMKLREIGIDPSCQLVNDQIMADSLNLLRSKRKGLSKTLPSFVTIRNKLHQEVNALVEEKFNK